MPAPFGRLPPLRPSPRLASAAAAIAGAAALALLVRLALTMASPAQLPVPPLRDGAGAGKPDATSLAHWHLFGQADDATLAQPLARALRGVAASPDPAHGRAFLADAEGRDGSYRVGETLPGGSVLLAVHADGIEIRHQGQRRRVPLAAPGPEPAADPAESPANDPPQGIAPPEVAPVVRDGRMLGLNVAFADAALRERLGLRPDDLVTTVDGRAADSPGLAEALEQRLARGDALRLGVRRGGSDLTLNLAARNP